MKNKSNFDYLSIAGVILGFGIIIFAQYIDGANLYSLLNLPAALIVIGGTLGAICIETPFHIIKHAIFRLKWLVHPPIFNKSMAVEKVISWSRIEQRKGAIYLEKIYDIDNNLLVQKGINLLASGASPENIRDILEVELFEKIERENKAASVYESMAAYSPTIGMIGAILGLVHVLSHLTQPERLGTGIAMAFIATLYGVGIANLLLLPMANKLRYIIGQYHNYLSIYIEGIIAMAQKHHPEIIKLKVEAINV